MQNIDGFTIELVTLASKRTAQQVTCDECGRIYVMPTGPLQDRSRTAVMQAHRSVCVGPARKSVHSACVPGIALIVLKMSA